MESSPISIVETKAVDNFYARSARGMADSYGKAAQVGADLSRLRVDSIGPEGAWIRHLPSLDFPHAAMPNENANDEASSSDGVFVLCGCAYLSASFWPETIAAAHSALDSHGVGSYDSAPLSGETHHHERVKDELLKLYRPAGGGAAFLAISASMANITAIPMLVGRGDTIFADAESHMTLMQGFTASQARVLRFGHNDMQDLERKLIEADRVDPERLHRRLLVSDGIFSMSGHVCNLPQLVVLARRYQCRLLIDEAHALGALGPRGRGTADHWNLDPACIDVVTGTLAKSVGAQGGYIICNISLAQAVSYEYTTNRVFSSGVPASIAAAAAEVLRQINMEADAGAFGIPVNTFHSMYRRQRRNMDILCSYLHKLQLLGIETDPDGAPGPVQRVVVGNEQALFEIQKRLYQRGVYVLGIVYPAVPQGRDQFRVTVMPAISENQMHACGNAIVEVCRSVLQV
jgi:7-keto-8-aminopelargonate synthetase-like enzyme